jgi:glycosyltransferase involved in cell wall biosynthesis
MNPKTDSPMTVSRLNRGVRDLIRRRGIQAAYNDLMSRELALGLRRPTLAVYDHAFQFIGGAQKYGLTLTSALQDLFDVTILTNRDIGQREFREWYGLDLSSCAIKVIPLPFFEERKVVHLDPSFVTRDIENPFHRISRESGRYDVFVNNSMNEMVYPLARESVLICHFPERRPKSYFYADRYTRVVCNSRYTAEWIEKKWKFRPHRLLYPPVDMETGEIITPKKKIILSVARFEPEGFKRQREMIAAFLKLRRGRPDIAGEWKFVLAGGSNPGNAYLDGLHELADSAPAGSVELKVNIPAVELMSLYREASVFWHMCGLKQEDPGETEHFGMTVVEAMQNEVVPIVFDGGGLPEIVDHGVNGFRVRSTAELLERAMALFRDPALRDKLGRAAREKSRIFARPQFEATVRTIFGEILESLRSPKSPDRA